MLNKENLEKFSKRLQTSQENIFREYCQHLFLSYLYQFSGSEKLLFKGGTALRMVFGSPRFSEDLDFTGVGGISQHVIESLFTETLAAVEREGVHVTLAEGKETTGGYLGIATFNEQGFAANLKIEVSLRNRQAAQGMRVQISSEYLPPYTLTHVPTGELIKGKLAALFSRGKPRDFYDYFFLLSGNFAAAKRPEVLRQTLAALQKTHIHFRAELKKFLPASHGMLLRDFKKLLEQKIRQFL